MCLSILYSVADPGLFSKIYTENCTKMKKNLDREDGAMSLVSAFLILTKNIQVFVFLSELKFVKLVKSEK